MAESIECPDAATEIATTAAAKTATKTNAPNPNLIAHTAPKTIAKLIVHTIA